jgi:Xaa-Pro aminopeptidase
MKERLRQLRSHLLVNGLDAVIISSPANIVYYSGFSGFSSIERDGYLYITQKEGYICTGALYAEEVKHTIAHLTLLEYSGTVSLSTQLASLTKKQRLKRVGYEADNMTVSEWQNIKKTVPGLTQVDLRSVRERKNSDEVKNIRKAAAIAGSALSSILPRIKSGITEKELVFRLEDEIRKDVFDIAFPTIVAFGANAAIPHHKSNDTKLKNDDLILIDFGAVSNEYRSDMTRTFFIGKATAEQKKAYKAVLTAQQKAATYITSKLSSRRAKRGEIPKELINKNRERSLSSLEMTKHEISTSGVDKVAREYLITQGYPPIPHSLGHGIGLEVHEFPRLSPHSKGTLEEGMVFSIEPGVYLPGKFGIRIEDLYTIQNGTLKQLTASTSQLLTL